MLLSFLVLGRLIGSNPSVADNWNWNQRQSFVLRNEKIPKSVLHPADNLPKPTLSLVASLFNQNPTQLRTTINVHGTYTYNIHIHPPNFLKHLNIFKIIHARLNEKVSCVSLQQKNDLEHGKRP